MPEYVRARLENGSEVTLTTAQAERAGVKVLDKPATDMRGRPLSPKHRTTVDEAAAKKSTAKKAASKKPGGEAASTPEEAS